MKKYVFLLSLFLTTACVAQVESPVAFTYSAKKIDSLTYELRITAVIQSGWHTYSQTTPAGGPIPTSIRFFGNPLVSISGKVKEEGKLEQHFEKIFGADVKQFSNKVAFIQIVKLKKAVKTNIGGTIEYMVCNDVQCLPPLSTKFSIAID